MRAGPRCTRARPPLARAAAWSLLLGAHGAEGTGASVGLGLGGFPGKALESHAAGSVAPSASFDEGRRRNRSEAPRDDGPLDWRPGRPRRSARHGGKDFPLGQALAVLAGLAGLWGVGASWCAYLAERPPCDSIRFWLVCATGVVSAVELGLYSFREDARLWFALAVVPVNVWGMLDAALRFPTARGACSFFATKQLGLLVLKLVMYTFGLGSVYASLLSYASLVLANLVMLPLMYLLALSECTAVPPKRSKIKIARAQSQSLAAASARACDVDILLGALRVCMAREGREAVYASCVKRARSMAVSVLLSLPRLLQASLANVSPWCHRALRVASTVRV